MSSCIQETGDGTLRGDASSDGLCSFLGIPYASPPLGERRFRPPVLPDPWKGERDATRFGADCLQAASTIDGKTGRQSEDCLTLNIWTPRMHGRLPVMVFIHGGAFREGGSSSPLYEAADLARRGIVAITFNYRLGPMGFLVSLQDGLMGNLGLWDQQLALEWVQRNVHAFGGDARHVTLFGESAGAMSIAVHLTLHSSARLFSRAILQSNPASYRYRDVVLADKLGRAFKERVQCRSLSELQREPASSFIREWLMIAVPRSVGDFIFWGPVHGAGTGVLISSQMWARAAPQPKPLIIGSNADEGLFFAALAFQGAMPRLSYSVTAGYLFKLDALRVLAHYAAHARGSRHQPEPQGADTCAASSSRGLRRGDHRGALGAILSDYMFKCALRNASANAVQWAARRRAHDAPIYMYEFSQPSNHTGPPLCFDRACHAAELPFVFNRSILLPEFSVAEAALSSSIIDYWTNFAKFGDPNVGLEGRSSQPFWPRWMPGSQARLNLRWPLDVGSTACDLTCDFWDELGYFY